MRVPTKGSSYQKYKSTNHSYSLARSMDQRINTVDGVTVLVSHFTNNHLRGCGARLAMSHALNPSSVPIQDSKRGYRQITP
ncbi:MAG: hypothetical protein ACRCX4_11820, partial [Bacteroidales bacterium]